MSETIIIVVLSDKSYRQSTTLNCLMDKSYSESDLLIINIGPESLKFDKDFIHTLGFYVRSIDIKEYLDERSLSGIYNSIIRAQQQYDRFIFFDDSSSIKKGYLNKLDSYYSKNVDLQLSNLRNGADGKIVYPIVDQLVSQVRDGVIIKTEQQIMSLGFGLVVYRSLIDKFYNMNQEVFDDSYSLYDIDCSFFIRLELLKGDGLNIGVQVVNTLGNELNIGSSRDFSKRQPDATSEKKTHFLN